MSRSGATLSKPTICFPRVSGDEPKTADSMAEKLGFSPRERG